MKYCKTQIGDLVTLRQGFAINKKTNHHMSEEPTQLHLLRIGDMKDGNFSIFVRDTIPEKFVAKENDIIYTRTGQVGLVFRNQYGVVHNNCFTVTSNDENVLSQQYLYYALQEESFYEEANSRATGAAQPDLPHGAFNSIEIFLPPIEAQRKITNILDSYNSLIDNNQKQIKLLEEAAQRLYKEWFIDLRFPDHENVKIIDGVPEGWKKIKIADVVTVLRRGISPEYSEDGKYTVISQKCIRSSIVSFEESRKQNKKYPTELNIRDSDTVICSTGTGTLGRVGQIYGDYPATTIDSHVTLVRSASHANLLYYSIKAKQEYLMGMGRGSTNQLELYKDVIGETEILWPSIDISSQFEKMATAIHEMITVLGQKIKRCIEARDRLLPKLMSGEIEL